MPLIGFHSIFAVFLAVSVAGAVAAVVVAVIGAWQLASSKKPGETSESPWPRKRLKCLLLGLGPLAFASLFVPPLWFVLLAGVLLGFPLALLDRMQQICRQIPDMPQAEAIRRFMLLVVVNGSATVLLVSTAVAVGGNGVGLIGIVVALLIIPLLLSHFAVIVWWTTCVGEFSGKIRRIQSTRQNWHSR